MSDKKVRVRFAPSPTGGLHLGGVRTVLFNYLFAKHHGGDFILRIEDTDQTRFVPGAEEYIFDCLKWTGMEPVESVQHGGHFGPYRQSERKDLYRNYAEQLVAEGLAYYAFDTPAELDTMRQEYKTAENPLPQYDHKVRLQMINSLTLDEEELHEMLHNGTPHVIRLKMPENDTVSFTDMIRGEISFNTSLVDDKVLLKADGMPTYHLAVVVDDYLMQITHAFRGEEWLPSAPVHILLWKYLFGLDAMPQWAHFPLILGPNGKLSKRDGAKYGFPVYAMNWTDPKTEEITEGFREKGFLPEAFINMLVMLGWNDGSEQEVFSMEELIEKFSMDRVHNAGARFDYEKAKWFNHEWIKKLPAERLLPDVKSILLQNGLAVSDDGLLLKSIDLVKERCTLLSDFQEQLSYFFKTPESPDLSAIQPKWNEGKSLFFQEVIRNFRLGTGWQAQDLESNFKEIAAANQLKPGEVMLPLRLFLVGGKFGPGVFEIAELIGKEETIKRIESGLKQLVF
ncbi:MAG TPA: glutamate--tRNA ligase [Niabella sp.]|nr:glutamate--tRNA ligase [Niabella sp.]HQW14236.1 glutamate--tRNA ligase [Niabella sp.]HQX19636.1 glutamate--tRNA ligase [Niabella sp.]HQX39930.1 glutamate--tRNA ligase [Niabella sp.]HRB06923.1 glutamate--tRNA ligase [Niabella sp.]